MSDSISKQQLQDQQFMERAIELAAQGIYSTKPNPAVGCVLVKEGEVIGEGWHQKAGLPHAEPEAIANAQAQGNDISDATAYVTLEPCSHFGRTPPCALKFVEAGLKRVVIAMTDPNPLVAGKGVDILTNAGIKVETGLLEDQARQLNRGFLKRMEKQLPFVRLKIASSLDGRTAMQNGESHWITGPESRAEVHRMRAQAGALITGIGTVLADDPSLNVRLPAHELAELNLTTENCNPIRVVLDPHLSMPLDAKMLSLQGRTILMTTKESVENNKSVVSSLHHQEVEIVAVSAEGDHLDIESILSYLAQEEQINDVMVESGAIVAGAFIQSGFVDELHCFIAPSLMGDRAKPMFVLPGIENMSDKLTFKIQQFAQFGEDLKIVLTTNQN